MEYSTFTQEQRAFLHASTCPDLSIQELDSFLVYCDKVGLDPFLKQAYAIRRNGKITHQASIDGMRILSERSGKYTGMTETLYCDIDGIWVDSWLKTTPPAAAKVGIYRADFDHPMYAVAMFNECAPLYNGKASGLWSKMPATMLAKCAEAAARRKAFPAQLGGVYEASEIDDAVSLAGDSSRVQSRAAHTTKAQPHPVQPMPSAEEVQLLVQTLIDAEALGIITRAAREDRTAKASTGGYTLAKLNEAVGYLSAKIAIHTGEVPAANDPSIDATPTQPEPTN